MKQGSKMVHFEALKLGIRGGSPPPLPPTIHGPMPKSAHLRVQKVMTLNSPCFCRSYPNCMYEQENKRNSITHTHFKTPLLVHFSLDAVGHCSCHKCFTKWLVLVTVKTLLQKEITSLSTQVKLSQISIERRRSSRLLENHRKSFVTRQSIKHQQLRAMGITHHSLIPDHVATAHFKVIH